MSNPINKKILRPRPLLQMELPCSFNGQMDRVTVYLGNPEFKHNPVFFQNKFIGDMKGGAIPDGVLQSLDELKKLAQTNGVNFVDLCKEALSSMIYEDKSLPDDKKVIVDEAKKDLDAQAMIAKDSHNLEENLNDTKLQTEKISIVSTEQSEIAEGDLGKIESKVTRNNSSDLEASNNIKKVPDSETLQIPNNSSQIEAETTSTINLDAGGDRSNSMTNSTATEQSKTDRTLSEVENSSELVNLDDIQSKVTKNTSTDLQSQGAKNREEAFDIQSKIYDETTQKNNNKSQVIEDFVKNKESEIDSAIQLKVTDASEKTQPEAIDSLNNNISQIVKPDNSNAKNLKINLDSLVKNDKEEAEDMIHIESKIVAESVQRQVKQSKSKVADNDDNTVNPNNEDG